METRQIIELREWEKNPKRLSQKAYERLKDSITLLGQFKPILITKDNVVIGGNQRFKALKELGFDTVWVSVISFVEDQEKIFAEINGQRQLKAFDSELQAMTEYALADNSRSGTYDENELANLLSEADLDFSIEYSIDFGEPVNIAEAIEQEAKKANNFNVTIQCVNADEQEATKQKLRELGYSVK